MSPPISKDWWVAAAITGAALPSAIGQTPVATTAPAAGVITGAEAGKPATVQPLYMNGAAGQRVVTGAGQTVHVLFPDQSALTVGPNSDITISRLEYDARSKNGSIVVDMAKGLLRVVGGFISKRSEMQVRTATATVGIRGGISIAETDGNRTSATFLFGQQLRMTGGDGTTRTVTRPGFGVSSGPNGMNGPQRSDLNQLMSRFGSPGGGGSGGAGGQGGNTLGGGNPNDLRSDRLGRNNEGPGNGGNQQDPPPTLKEILGGQSSPGNQS